MLLDIKYLLYCVRLVEEPDGTLSLSKGNKFEVGRRMLDRFSPKSLIRIFGSSEVSILAIFFWSLKRFGTDGVGLVLFVGLKLDLSCVQRG